MDRHRRPRAPRRRGQRVDGSCSSGRAGADRMTSRRWPEACRCTGTRRRDLGAVFSRSGWCSEARYGVSLAAAAIGAFLALAAPRGGRPRPRPRGPRSLRVQSAACHATDGAGVADRGPSLRPRVGPGPTSRSVPGACRSPTWQRPGRAVRYSDDQIVPSSTTSARSATDPTSRASTPTRSLAMAPTSSTSTAPRATWRPGPGLRSAPVARPPTSWSRRRPRSARPCSSVPVRCLSSARHRPGSRRPRGLHPPPPGGEHDGTTTSAASAPSPRARRVDDRALPLVALTRWIGSPYEGATRPLSRANPAEGDKPRT